MRKALLALPLCLLACGNPAPVSNGAAGSTTTAGTVGLSSAAAGASGTTGGAATNAASGSTTSGAAVAGTTSGAVSGSTTSAAAASGTTAAGASSTTTSGGPTVPDPTINGRYSTVQGSVEVTSSNGDTIPMIYYYPAASPDAGSPGVGTCPIVIFAHGFLIDASAYETYASHLSSFGYVVVLPNYPDANEIISSANDDKFVQDLLVGVTFAQGTLVESDPAASMLADKTVIGISGHSLGGKLAILAAEQNPGMFKASIDFDPVDDVSCGSNCPSATAALGSLSIPTAFVGETTDQSGGGIFSGACAPASENFQIFYQDAVSPSLQGTVTGAGSESFLDNTSLCTLGCVSCTSGNATETLSISHAMLVAFYERYLRGNTGYDTWLNGALSTSTWVTPGELSLLSK